MILPLHLQRRPGWFEDFDDMIRWPRMWGWLIAALLSGLMWVGIVSFIMWIVP